MGIHQKISMPNYQKLKNDGEEKVRSKTLIAKFSRQTWENWDMGGGYESQEITWCWKRTRSLLSVESEKTLFERSAMQFPARRARQTPKTAPSSEPPPQKMWKCVEEKGTSEAEVRPGSRIDSRAETSWKVFAQNYFVTIAILPNVSFFKSELGCKFGNKSTFPHKKGWGTTE